MATVPPLTTILPTAQEWKDVLEEILPPQGEWSEDEYLVLTDHRNRLVEFTDGFLEILPMPTDKRQAIWGSCTSPNQCLGSTKAARTGGGMTASAPLTAFQMISLKSRSSARSSTSRLRRMRDLGHRCAAACSWHSSRRRPGDGRRG